MTAEPPRPLFEAVDARVAVDGVVAIDRLNLASNGERVLFAGDTAALFAALTNVPIGLRAASASAHVGDEPPPPAEAALVAGAIKVDGVDLGASTYHEVVGCAALDPPLPPGWSCERFVAWSARLGGASTRDANALAGAALARVGLHAQRAKGLQRLSLPERRVLAIAQAVVLAPRVVILEAPLAGLDADTATFVLAAIGAATDGRRGILSSTRIDPASPEGALAAGASHIVVLAGGDVVFEGGLSDIAHGARQYTLLVRQNGDALRAALAPRGIDLRGGPMRFSAALAPGMTTRELITASLAVDAPLLELIPLVG